MKKKKSLDPGLTYLMEIGFDRIKGKYGLQKRWTDVFGKEKAEQLLKERNRIPDGSLEFYEFKNSNPEISKSLSETYDFDIIRKACNYIDSHDEYFGDSILEVGCESGYMTAFLAKRFPNSQIISIDRSAAATTIAKQRVQSLGIQNVEIRNCSLEDVTESFDTVFCMRTLQENIDKDRRPYEGEPIIYQTQEYAKLTDTHTTNLLSHMKDSGYLCAFERVGHDPLMCGWLLNLNEKECGIIPESYQEIKCEEVDERSTFQAFACKNKTSADTMSVYDLWYQAIGVKPDGHSTLELWNALVYLAINAGTLIYGGRVISYLGCTVGRFALFSDCDDENQLYLLWAVGTDIELYAYNSSLKDEIVAHVKSVLNQNKQSGHTIKIIDPNEETLEGNLRFPKK